MRLHQGLSCNRKVLALRGLSFLIGSGRAPEAGHDQQKECCNGFVHDPN